MIAATEKELKKIKQSVDRPKKPLRGKIKIALRVGEKINKFKVRKHFDIKIEKDSFNYKIEKEKVDFEASLDGIFIIRTRISAEHMSSEESVRAYKGLAKVDICQPCCLHKFQVIVSQPFLHENCKPTAWVDFSNLVAA